MKKDIYMQSNQLLILAGIGIVGSLIYFLSPILTPFLVGTLLAYLTEPLVKKLIQLRLSRKMSVSIVFLALFFMLSLLILLLIPVMGKQMDTLSVIIPKVIEWLQDTILPWLKDNFGIDEGMISIPTLKAVLSDNLGKASSAADWMVKAVVHSGAALLEWIFYIILIPVVMFYLLCDWVQFVKGIRNLFPRDLEPAFTKIMNECDEVLSAFFRGQLIVMVVVGTLYATGLTIIGLQVGLVVGVIAGIVSIVPYLGFIVGITIATIAALVQFGSFSSVLLVWLVFVVVHVIENIFLLPNLMGNRIGLHPVAVIFAILAGGCLFGFLGVLLALPVASVIMVCIRHLHHQYRKSNLYKASE